MLASILMRTTVTQARSIDDDGGDYAEADSVQKIAFETGVAFEVTSSVDPLAALVTAHGTSTNLPLFEVRAKKGGPSIRSAPSDTATSLSGLYYDTYLPVYGQLTDSSGEVWYSVRLWGALNGWIRADQTETGDPPTPTPVPASESGSSAVSGDSSPPSAIFPLKADGQARDLYVLRQDADAGSPWLGLVQPGERVAIRGWRADSSGSAWYEVRSSDGDGWVWAGGVDLASSPEGPRRTTDGRITFIHGKGMWLPTPLVEMASPEAIVAAAKVLGLSHIYLEAGASRSGFYGKDQAERLLAAAHHSGIRVVAWLMTTLDDIPTDISLCKSVVSFRTTSGDGFDGIAPDVEYNMDSDDVRAFSEILRAELGQQALIVGIIYPVGTIVGQEHPIAGILGRSVDALAPMSYWHDAKRPFDPSEITDFIKGAVDDVHVAVGDPNYPVEIIGQSYDAFSRNGAGRYSPTGDEVTAALGAARDAGAYAVSLFQWGTTTPAEWDALRGLAWNNHG
jgi:hypothetical protein